MAVGVGFLVKWRTRATVRINTSVPRHDPDPRPLGPQSAQPQEYLLHVMRRVAGGGIGPS